MRGTLPTPSFSLFSRAQSPAMPMSTSIPYVGIASLSLAASLSFGAFKFFSLWERVRRFELDNHRLTSELHIAKQTLHDRDVQLRQQDDSILALKQENEESRVHTTSLTYALQTAENTNRELVQKTRDLGSEVAQLSKELKGLKREHHDAQTLLDIRTHELSGAQAFLTTADVLSGGDVINMVEALNAEIMQLSAHMAETYSPMFSPPEEGDPNGSSPPTSTRGLILEELAIVKSPGDDDPPFPRTESPEELLEAEVQAKDAMAQALEVFGPTMVEFLQKTDHSQDPILLQFAFQAGLSAYTHWIISSWFFEDPEDEVLLSEIYARVREAEEQSVSGRWRALTRQHVQRMMRSKASPSHSPSPSPDVTDLVVYMVDALVNVLLISGLNNSPQRHTHTELHSKITTTFAAQLNVVLSSAKRLNKAAGELVTSCDLEALYIAPDCNFNGAMMEDASGAKTPNTTPTKVPERVLCTTDLGLVRAEKVTATRGEWSESVLLKPKVVLVSGLQEILGS